MKTRTLAIALSSGALLLHSGSALFIVGGQGLKPDPVKTHGRTPTPAVASTALAGDSGGAGACGAGSTPASPGASGQRGVVVAAVTFEAGSSPARPSPALLSAIIAVESGGNPNKIGDDGDAVGLLQIHKCVVDDVNNIILHRKAYTYADRRDPVKSVEMFNLYIGYWCYGWRDQDVARTWNGGPCGAMRESTLPYWAKVRKEMEAGDGK